MYIFSFLSQESAVAKHFIALSTNEVSLHVMNLLIAFEVAVGNARKTDTFQEFTNIDSFMESARVRY